jgi:hypothetical protein
MRNVNRGTNYAWLGNSVQKRVMKIRTFSEHNSTIRHCDAAVRFGYTMCLAVRLFATGSIICAHALNRGSATRAITWRGRNVQKTPLTNGGVSCVYRKPAMRVATGSARAAENFGKNFVEL